MITNIRLILAVPPQHGLLEGFVNGVMCLANYVDQKLPSVQVDLVDFSNVTSDRLREEIRDTVGHSEERLVVGITTLTAYYQASLKLAQIYKEMIPDCVTVLGGHHASADVETILSLHNDIVDFIIVGEGERALVEFLQRLGTPKLDECPGLAFVSNGRVVRNSPPPALATEELDMLPVTYGDFGPLGTPGKFGHTTIVTARGCPLACAFCAVANEKIRSKSIIQIVRDVKTLTSLGYSRFAIEDNFFSHSPRRTDDLCAALSELRRSGVEFTWDCQTRVESMMRDGIVGRMAQAGCEAVYLGVESVCDDQLLYLQKTRQPERYLEQLCEVVARLVDSPIDCYMNLQFGLPGETPRHYQHTYRTLSDLGSKAAAAGRTITIFPQLFVIYPGTSHFRAGVAQGKFSSDVFESFTEWESEQTPILVWLGEHFAHGTGGLPEGILDPVRLRAGEYVIDGGAVGRISNALRLVNGIPGVEVFDYSDHLTNELDFLTASHSERRTRVLDTAVTERSIV